MLQQVKGKSTVVLAAAMALLLLGSACAPSAQAPAKEAGAPAEQPKAEAPKGPVGKAVVALAPQTTATVDPALQGGASDFVNLEALYNRLTETPVDSLKPSPGIATEWSMSPDGLSWEFKIRKGVKFHNGDELTPEDVAFSITRVPTIARPSEKAIYDRFIEGVQTQGDKVVIRLKIPDWTFLNIISGSSYAVVPKRYLEQVGNDGFLKAPVGTGPFKFVAGAKQEFLKLEAVGYEHFLWRPGVKQLEYRIVPEETTRLAMLRTSEADLAQISVTSLRTIEGDSKLRAIKVPNNGGLRIFMFGQHDPQNPMSKLEVRKALSLAIDRQAIAEGIYRGYARPSATGIWNPALEGWPQWDPPKQDMETAKKLLAQAGYPGGKGLKFTFHNWEYAPLPLWTQVAPVLIEQWRQLGIEVDSRVWEWGAYAPMAREGKLEPVAVSTHIANGSGEKGNIGDLTRIGLYNKAAGVAEGAHPELMKMAEAFEQELDPKKRAVLLDKILAYDRENVVMIPVILQDSLWGAGPRLVEYTPRPGTYSSGNMYTIKVKP